MLGRAPEKYGHCELDWDDHHTLPQQEIENIILGSIFSDSKGADYYSYCIRCEQCEDAGGAD